MSLREIPVPKLTFTHKLVLAIATASLAVAIVAALFTLWALALSAIGFLIVFTFSTTLSYNSLLAKRLERHAQRAAIDSRDSKTLLRSTLSGSKLTSKEMQHLSKKVDSALQTPIRGVPAETSSFTTEEPVGLIPHAAARLRRSPTRLLWFVDQAKKTRSQAARDVLSHAATQGRYNYRQLAVALEASRTPELRVQAMPRLSDCLWEAGALSLARLLFCQRTQNSDLQDALSLYEILLERWGPSSLEPVDYSYYADLLVTFRRYDDALATLNVDQRTSRDRQLWHRFLRLNAINPSLPGATSTEADWLADLNEILAERGFAPIRLAAGSDPAFYRLDSDASPLMESTALVSVIMPIYEPDDSTDKAIESLLKQTWTNIELIIVDDGSPREHPDGSPTAYVNRLESWAQRDDRIRLILNEENRGAYWARNVGYEAAAGKYVTIADKDDWHHPQKIEYQASKLEQDPSLIANMTNWVRTDANLRFLFRWGPDRLIHPSFASIMYRREEVKQTLGYWDNVRKSGDNEFRMRLQNHYGVKIEALEPLPLAFSLLGEGNLTSEDFGLGFEHDGRKAYRRSYERWHRTIADGASPYMELSPAERLFPAPNGFLPSKPDFPKFDVVFVSDFGRRHSNAETVFHEISVAVEIGLTIGVVNAVSLLDKEAAQEDIIEEVETLIYEGVIQHLTLADELEASLVLVHWPSALQITRDARSNIVADNIVVIANQPPYDAVSESHNYDIFTITDNIKSIFDKHPRWAATSQGIRASLTPLVAPELLLDELWDGVIAASARTPARDVTFSGTPVIGRHARDIRASWPDNGDTFLKVFPVDGSVSVSILGGAKVPVTEGFITKRNRGFWEVSGFGEKDVQIYLDELDFFVHFPHAAATADDDFSILEALSRGVVCVLPQQFESRFGDAVICCSSNEVQGHVQRLWADSNEYYLQRERGFRFLDRTATGVSYGERLKFLNVNASTSSLATESREVQDPRTIAV